MPQGTIVRHDEAEAFEAGLRSFFSYRDLGIREASSGRIGAHVIRAVPGTESPAQWHTHALDFQMVYVLRGWVKFEYEGVGPVTLRKGSCVHQPPGIRHREVAHSADLEMLEIVSPARFATKAAKPPRGLVR